jgi:hypothetical protein
VNLPEIFKLALYTLLFTTELGHHTGKLAAVVEPQQVDVTALRMIIIVK